MSGKSAKKFRREMRKMYHSAEYYAMAKVIDGMNKLSLRERFKLALRIIRRKI